MVNIPFNKIYFTGNELKFIKEALDKESVSGDGYFTSLVTSFLEERFSISKILMTTSGTHALEIAMMLIDLKPDDEVIMPSFTFPSTANSVMLRGGKPVFAEISQKTLNIDPKDIEKRITEKTRAIIPVHYGGVGCDMESIMDIAKKHNLYVIEDAAQGLNAKYKDKYLGTWGHIGCYSFHGTKNYICGEGGAITLNSDDKSLSKRAEIIRQKGTNRSLFIKGEVDKYSWVDKGSSYTPSDILMAVLYAQLQQLDYIKESRKKVADFYIKNLQKHIESGIIKGMMDTNKYYDPNYHLFYLVFKDEMTRDNVIDKLRSKGVKAVIHFVPLHSSVMGQSLGYKPNSLPITENIGRTLLRLPFYTSMSDYEMEHVVKSLNEVLKEL